MTFKLWHGIVVAVAILAIVGLVSLVVGPDFLRHRRPARSAAPRTGAPSYTRSL